MPADRASSSNLPALAGTTGPATPAAVATQLKDLPLNELRTMARDYGLNPNDFDTKPALVAAVLDRRTMIGALDRDAMLDVLHWAGRSPTNAAALSKERLAIEIARVKTMRFVGLSHRGLIVLARLRGIDDVREDDATPDVIARLKSREGLFAKLARKRRQITGKLVSRMLGDGDDDAHAAEHAALPPGTTADQATTASTARKAAERNIKDEIEESGLIAGLTSRMRRSADQYLNQKLDEIEARIDRKLDEIDRRLSEWRDKEVANRIRILKLSLWVTVIVGAATLIISYVRVYMPWLVGAG